jgi:uncharacterized protein (TIGR03000 family)
MYSVILMAAMTANTAEAPAFHWQKACGCQGGLYLHSGGYGSCMGCWGACYGCSGGCYGCHGACYGGSGCYGCMGCYGTYDAGYGGHGGWYGYGAVYDGGMMNYPAGNPMNTGTTPPAPGTPPVAPGTPPVAPGTPPKPGTSAKLIIEKPADAKIYVDDKLVTSEGTRQTFATPALDPAQAYYYTVRVEAVRDGKPAGETRRVIVRSGETVQESFRDASIATASAAK